MPFALTIDTKHDGQFNWFDLPDSGRLAVEELREQFNLVQYNPSGFLTVEGISTTFEKPWSEIVGIRISD
jgi:hypothetical protein